MLELGKGQRGELPVLRDGTQVATLRASNWKERATAVIDGQEWVFAKAGRALTGSRAGDPAGTARQRADRASVWKGTWALDLEGLPARLRPASRWKGTYALERDGRVVGEAGSTGRWSPRATLQADDLPLHQQVFVLWVQLLFQRRAAAAAAAA